MRAAKLEDEGLVFWMSGTVGLMQDPLSGDGDK